MLLDTLHDMLHDAVALAPLLHPANVPRARLGRAPEVSRQSEEVEEEQEGNRPLERGGARGDVLALGVGVLLVCCRLAAALERQLWQFKGAQKLTTPYRAPKQIAPQTAMTTTMSLAIELRRSEGRSGWSLCSDHWAGQV